MKTTQDLRNTKLITSKTLELTYSKRKFEQ